MGLLGFSFGKKRRHHKRRVSKKHSKAHRKPPAKLLRICKKYRVKATKKVGKKRVYKSVATLKKLCLRKARALRKKLLKAHKKSMKHHKKTHRRRVAKTHRRRRATSMGEDMMMGEAEDLMSFGARRRLSRFGLFVPVNRLPTSRTCKTTWSKIPSSRDYTCKTPAGKPGWVKFGKRRSMGRAHKVNKKASMKAFRSFYKRHCAGARRSRFGFGSNPSLNASMGYEFCPNGQGGVLGFNSTGLFPSPCTALNSSALTNEMAADLPDYSSSFGRLRRRSTRRRSTRRRVSSIGARRRRTAVGSKKKQHRTVKKRMYAYGAKRRVTTIGARRRRSTRRRV